LAAVVADDLEIWGAGYHVTGRENIVPAITSPGLSNCRMRVGKISGEISFD
jgi:hypothetical protein